MDLHREHAPADARHRPRHFVPTTLDSALAREGALYALRMIEGQRWHQRLWSPHGIRDRDVLHLVGLEQDEYQDGNPALADLRDALARQLRRLEARRRPADDLLARNVDKIGNMLRLNTTERAILRLATVVTRLQNFGDLFAQAVVVEGDLMRAIRFATGCRLMDVRRALADDRTLRRSGFFQYGRFPVGVRNPLDLDDDVVGALLAQRLDESRLLRRLLRVAPPSTLSLADFGHLRDLDLIQRYLRDALQRRRKGVNVLLYGAPGTGKTEFVRALAPALKVGLHEVPNEDADGDPISGRARFGAYSVCQNILGHQRGQILLFDEVEDVFGSGGDDPLAAMFGLRRESRDPERLRKSWVNETLESNPVPALWVCNTIGAMDRAFLRRFDLIVEFAAPGRAVRQRFVERHFRPGEISPGCAQRLAEIEQLPPAQIERAARVVRSLRSREVAVRDAEVEHVVMASMRAMGIGTTMPPPTLPAHYDPAFLNTDRDLDAIARGLTSGSSARLCLYGPPGTGKTAFAHHLGHALDRSVIVKRASDVLDMFVGGSEANIRKAFAQARQEGAILVMDEADSLLRERSHALQGFEVSQVNEMLTQMEAFDGIFVASTNLIDSLDAASMRRFDFKVKFDYLTREQRRALLLRVVADANEPLEAIRPALAALDALQQVTPGDFANALRQLRVTGEAASAQRIVGLLAGETRLKPEGRRRTIGFAAA